MKKVDLSIVIPVYNEQDNVDDLHSKLDTYLEKLPLNVELVFVDDGSQDKSVSMLCSKQFKNAQVKIIQLSKNFGSHAAIRAGFQNASADVCMIYFMDMQDPFEIIEQFYTKIQEGYNIAYAERVGYQASLGSRIYGKLVRKLIVQDYPSNGISCFMIDKKVKDEFNRNIESNSSIYFQLFTLGFKKAGIPCACKERKNGKSGWTFAKKVRLLVDSFVAFSKAPAHFVTAIGAIMAIIGILWAIVIVIIKLFNLAPLSAGWPTLMALLLFGFGITNLSIGIIAEYLCRTLDAARKRPVFIVEEIIDCDKKEEELL